MTISNKWKIPLYFAERYFVLQSDIKISLNVILKYRDKMIYEIKDNSPIENPFSYTHKIYIEEIAASDKISGRMLYKINLGSFFIIKIFFKNGNEYKMAIDGDRIMIGNSLVKNRLNGNYINVAINSDGSLNKNILMPYELLEFLSNY